MSYKMARKSYLQNVIILGSLLLLGGCSLTEVPDDLAALGLTYELQELDEPRINRVHVLRVDFSGGRVDAVVITGDDPDGEGPAEVVLTDPITLTGDLPVLAVINANPWDSLQDAAGNRNRRWYEGQPVDIHGLLIANGQIRSADDGKVAVWVDASGRVSIGTAPTDNSAKQAMAGFGQIVQDGEIVVMPGGAIHPRTAMGVDSSGQVMWLVVVDGRQQGYSEGTTVHELAQIMERLGCWDAANMDGGGSSIMGSLSLDGQMRIVNSPSDRIPTVPMTPRIRPLPMVLTIQEKANKK